ncbi:MAG: Membrane-bound lytic murein transglycosylase B [Alphaproteobacteria bacterium MarineAlpha3_Bin4]|nr:MAG: Membrane-bound lytic murein transglycosylase B [Alphaproteobacteria bacterium MarineAlpha3_Bin4]
MFGIVYWKIMIISCVAAITLWPAATPQAQPVAFAEWLKELKTEARARGIRPVILDSALAGVRPIKRVIELDRRQPEFTLVFWDYLSNSVNDQRVWRGRKLLAEHRPLLKRVARKYGVQPRFLVAFWGLESNFGDFTGKFSVIGALVTLAFDPRRAKFFREQLLAALSLINDGHMAVGVKGSWAGAMGNHQFIPTTYRDFAVDFDGDGRRDLWNSLPDIFASAANYLSRSGWDDRYTWGREIRLPPGFNPEVSALDIRKPLSEWQQLGVRRFDGRDLPAVDLDGSVILPAGFNGPAFLVYKNYRTVLVWNRSIFYAIAVGHLADRINGGGPLLAVRPDNEVTLSRADIIDMQRRLMRRGFDPGAADGTAGPMTRKAIKAFQKSVHLPADGFPSSGLLERLRDTGSSQ